MLNFTTLCRFIINFRDENMSTPLRFTYTAMHGVGYQSILDAFKQFNLPPLIPVKQQVRP